MRPSHFILVMIVLLLPLQYEKRPLYNDHGLLRQACWLQAAAFAVINVVLGNIQNTY